MIKLNILSLLKRVSLFVLLLVVSFFVLLTLKTTLDMPSAFLHMGFLTIAVYLAVAIFSARMSVFKKAVCFLLALTAYATVLGVSLYVLYGYISVEGAATNPAFMGVGGVFEGVVSFGVADEIAFFFGLFIQVLTMYLWRSPAQAEAEVSGYMHRFFEIGYSWGSKFLGGIKKLTFFQSMALVLLTVNLIYLWARY